jgi:hypothetical protein
MITFQKFMELCESSSPESGRRRLASQGPLKNKFSRGRQRQRTVDKVALKKAGFKRSPSNNLFQQDHQASSSKYHATNIETYKNQSDYVSNNLPSKRVSTRGGEKPRPTKERVIKAKALRKQLGGDRTSKPVHDVSIHSQGIRHRKNDPDNLISRGKSFTKELRAVPDTLKKAGAKPGDKGSATPQGVLPGENRKQGAEKRDKIYTKALGSKMNPKTGRTIGNVRG